MDDKDLYKLKKKKKNLRLKKHQLNRWLQLIKIRRNQTKTHGVSQLEKKILAEHNSRVREEKLKKKGGSKQSNNPKIRKI